MPNMTLGQSVQITAVPTIGGVEGGMFANPVVWTHAISPSSAAVLFDPNANPTTVQIQTINNACVLTMTATSGTITANTSFNIELPADGGMINVGPIMPPA